MKIEEALPGDGRVGRFVAPDKVAGWVRMGAAGGPVSVTALFKGAAVGRCIADPSGDGALRQPGRLGFSIRLSAPLTGADVASADFVVVADLENAAVSLRKAATLQENGGPVSAPGPAKELRPARTARSALRETSPVSVVVGTQSPDGVVVVGREGFLFLIGGSNDVGAMYSLADGDVSRRWSGLLESRARALESLGARYLQVFIPEKSSVYPELFPEDVVVPSPCYAALKQAVGGNLPGGRVLFLEDILPSGDARKGFYRKTDSHLTIAGARRLFDAQLRLLGESPAYTTGPERWQTGVWDLGEKFTSPVICEDTAFLDELLVNGVAMQPEMVLEEKSASGNVGTRRVYMNPAAPIRKKVVLFVNSFYWGGGTSLGQCWWFARLFVEVHFVWLPEVDVAYVEVHRPDIVIAQSIERFMRRVPSS